MANAKLKKPCQTTTWKMLLRLWLLANLNHGRESKDTAQDQGPTPLYTHRKPYTFLKSIEGCCLTQTYTEVKGMLSETRRVVFCESERSVTAVCQLGSILP